MQHEQDNHSSEQRLSSVDLQQHDVCNRKYDQKWHQYKPFFLTAYRFPGEEKEEMCKSAVMMMKTFPYVCSSFMRCVHHTFIFFRSNQVGSKSERDTEKVWRFFRDIFHRLHGVRADLGEASWWSRDIRRSHKETPVDLFIHSFSHSVIHLVPRKMLFNFCKSFWTLTHFLNANKVFIQRTEKMSVKSRAKG